jgi:hypothetical protein
MVKKKLDPRIRGLIEAGVKKNQRSLFVLVGDHGERHFACVLMSYVCSVGVVLCN